MKTRKITRLLAIVSVLCLLVSTMAVQLASAWDQYGGYPRLTADEYYIKTSKFYEKDELYTTDIYQNTFDDNGFLVKQRVLTETRMKGDFPTDVTYTFKYDDEGRIIQQRCAEWMDDVDYEYRKNGVYIKQFIDGPAYTYNPVDKAYLSGVWNYEYDENGRRSRIYVEPNTTDLSFDESLFTYEEDENGRVSKMFWTNKSDGKTVSSGVMTYAYSENGNTEIDRYGDRTDYYEFNKDHQILEMRRVENDEVTAHWRYTYDSHGNTIKSENLINNSWTEYTYEHHTKKMSPDSTTPSTPDTPSPSEPGNNSEPNKESESNKEQPIDDQKTDDNTDTDSYDSDTSHVRIVKKNPQDGNWYLYYDDNIVWRYTGIAPNQYGWWRIKNGKVDFSATGIFRNEYGWWRVEKGKVNFHANGIYSNEFGWWKTTDGKVTFKETGVFKNEYGWWRVKDSKVDFKANGIYKNQYGWWKVKNSKVDFKFTGIAKNKYGTWYVKDGKVDFNKNGKVKFNGKTYTVKGGKVQ